MSRVQRTVRSDNDLQEIALFIALDNPDRAKSFVGEIIAAYDIIAGQPRMGRDRSELAPGLRSHPYGRYMIFYRAIRNGVQIIRVLHTSRDIPALFQ